MVADLSRLLIPLLVAQMGNGFTDELSEHDRNELLARARDAWERAPQNTMKAIFEWRGKNYVVSHSSVQLRIHTEDGIKVY